VNAASRRNLTGPLTIAAIFVFGFAVFVGLRLATRPSNPAPGSAKFAVPHRTMRVVSLDVSRIDLDVAIERINSCAADIVLLQNVRTIDVARIGEAIGMSRAKHPAGDVFYPSQNFAGPAAPYGNAIYSKFPLFEARSSPNRGGSFGVWAVASVGDAKFMLASMRPTDRSSEVIGTQDAMNVREREMSMIARAHRELGEPPIVIGASIVEFTPRDREAMDQLGQPTIEHGDAFLIARGWQVAPVEDRRLPDNFGWCVDLQPR
jgi:hypothetical protein